jgi:hypothetical protein
MNTGYETTDFWLAVFLKASGLKIITVKKNCGRSIFVFENRNDREQLIRDFYNDGLIRVNAVKNAAQDLKSMIHNL